MLNLTNIATTLQKEMTALSRRSKDNATDLVSLKEATKSRDEDIRKSLKELVSNSRAGSEVNFLGPMRSDISRSTSAMDFGPRFGSPSFGKSISLPRIPSVDEQDRASSPSPYSVEGASTMSMLEKIIREMVTKEGQERLISTLSEMLDKTGKESAETAKKVEELVQFIREKSGSQALVRHRDSRHISEELPAPPDERSLNITRDGPYQHAVPAPTLPVQPINIVNDELRQYLSKLKESVASGGGLTNEVKGLVRDLRGEVLGMGRELGKRLDNVGQASISDQALVLPGPTNDHLAQMVQEGLSELREQMEQVINAKRRQSSGSALSHRSVDGQDVHALVKQSLEEQGLEPSRALTGSAPEVDYDKIMDAMNEAFESQNFQPEVKVEYLGLDRDEILQCLKDGLEEHQSSRALPDLPSTSKEDIFAAVQEAMQHFTPPTPATELDEVKEELMLAVRDCLEEFKGQAPRPSSRVQANEISRDDILEAVREGLGVFKKEGAREIDINREDLFEAVKTGLDNLGYGDEVLQSLHDIVERVRVEFKEYSAANGRDTELVLDATKDGLENLRVNIEAYVDRSRDVLGKEEVIGELRQGLENLQQSIQSFAEQSARNGDTVAHRSELVDYIKSEFEHLHETIADQDRTRGNEESPMNKEHIIAALTAGVAELKAGLGNREFEGPTDEVLDAMKEEFDQLRDAVLQGSAAHKDELLESIQENMSSLGLRTGERGIDESGQDIIIAMKEEFDTLRASLQAPVLHTGQTSSNSEELLEALQGSLDNMRVQLSADRSEAPEEALGVIRAELEQLRTTMNTQIVPSASPDDRVVILQAIQESINELKATGLRTDTADSSEALHLIREELEALRASVSSAVVPSGGQVAQPELFDAMRSGFEEVRGRLEMISDRYHESADTHTGSSREILDTLKEGIAALRGDIEQVKSAAPASSDRGVVLAEGVSETRDFATEPKVSDALKREDLEKLEVALTRLHIKVEAMDQNIQASTPIVTPAPLGAANKEAFASITAMIGQVQTSIADLASREVPSTPSSSNGVSKEDTDALETLLQNAKAKIDDHVIPTLGEVATSDHLHTVEAVVRLMSESVEGLSAKFHDNLASKDDVASVYVLLEQASASIKEVQDAQVAAREVPQAEEEKVAKSHVDEVADLCKDIQSTVDDLPTTEDLPSKSDFEELTSLVQDFKTVHEGFKQQYETDLEITAQAFDDRKTEATKIMEQIDEIKEVVTASKDELKARMRRGNEDVRALDEILQGIEDKIDAVPDTSSEVQEVLEIVKREFEQAHANTEGLKTGHDEHFKALNDKHDEVRAAILDELVKKLDERFGAVMDRHDAQQLAVENATQIITSRAADQDELLSGSRAMAEDLKLTIDTLGSSVTEIAPALKDATEKMNDDSKTVYNKVDEMSSRLDMNHVDVMTGHDLTRQEISKAMTGLSSLHDEFGAFHPRALEMLTALLAVAGEHFEHTKQSSSQSREAAPAPDTSSIHETIKSSFASLEMPWIEAAPLPVVTDIYDDTHIRSKLDQILTSGKFDDAGKLDQLLDHAEESKKHTANFAKLDEIQQQVQTTAAEVTAFVALQTRSLTDAHEDKQEEARKAAADLERYNNQKQDMEVIIGELSASKTDLSATVEALQAERDAMTSQKSRLSAELSSIETALKIRREELETMDARADALERRIIQGVMDHSRALLIAKQPRVPVNMSLKRVASNASNTSAVTATPSTASSAMNLALKKKSGVKKSNTVSGTGTPERRIHSLSQITGNASTASNIASAVPSAVGLASLKRSQSVRNPALRKNSWAGQGSVRGFDKENMVGLSEEDEDATVSDRHSRPPTSMTDRTMTDRASSYSGTHVSGSERRTLYGTGPSGSEYSYGTGSYLTGSDISVSTDRRTSLGSTIRSTLGGSSLDDPIDEGEESVHDDDDDARVAPLVLHQGLDGSADHGETRVPSHDAYEAYEATDGLGELELASPTIKKPFAIRTDGYDSGLGSDLPTAALSSTGGSDYFHRS